MIEMTNIFRTILRRSGFDIIRYKDRPGRYELDDISKFVSNDQPVIFDVGANIGQSVKSYKNKFPNSIIYSFEPSPSTFNILKENVSMIRDVNIFNLALGSKVENKVFYENDHSDMSSFLTIGEYGWGSIVKETIVPVMTIDQFVLDNSIKQVDVLKIDTQGFDYEVIKGAEQTINDGRLKLLYFEIIFSDQYKDLPTVPEILSYLSSLGFKLVTLYPFSYQKGLASWTNGLFIHKFFIHKSQL